MRPQISRKTLVQLSVVVVLAAILVYLGFGGRSAPSRRGVSNQTAGRTAPPPVVPPAAPAARTAGPTSGAPGASPQPGAPVAQTPPAASQPRGGQTPGAGAAPQPAPAALPGAKPLAPSGPSGSGAPAPATAPAKQDPELAVVGAGARGRHDPFSPLVSNEPARATPSPTLPPPPGVGLPMPPGFAAPGAPGATQPPSPGAGMKVTGIMGSRARVAIIEVDGQTHIVGVGDRIGDAVVVSILPEKVIMKQHNVTFELGVGGERSS